MAAPKRYDMDFKKQAVRLAKEIGGKKAAKELNVSPDTLYGWMRKERNGSIDLGPGTRTPENALGLAEEVQQLRAENLAFLAQALDFLRLMDYNAIKRRKFMFKNTDQLLSELSDYNDKQHKIQRMIQKGTLFPLKRGLYETDSLCPGEALASVIYGPSYLSFEYALSSYGLIPERAYTYTSATLHKNRSREYRNHFGTFTYQDIPGRVFPHCLVLRYYQERPYTIASPEKALCDLLYKRQPASSYADFLDMLFSDLRMEESDLCNLDLAMLLELSALYQKKNLHYLTKFVTQMEGAKCGYQYQSYA